MEDDLGVRREESARRVLNMRRLSRPAAGEAFLTEKGKCLWENFNLSVCECSGRPTSYRRVVRSFCFCLREGEESV